MDSPKQLGITNPLYQDNIFTILLTIVLCGICIYQVFHCGLSLSPDSYTYLDIAQNIKQGLGFVHSYVYTHQIDEWDGVDKYLPVGLWGLGFPTIISIFTYLLPSVSIEKVGAFCVVVSLILILTLTYLWFRNTVGVYHAYWCLILIFITYPVAYIYSWVWSEGWATLFIVLCFYTLTSGNSKKLYVFLFLTGFFAGMAFLTRMALLILFPYIIVFILVDKLLISKFRNPNGDNTNTLLDLTKRITVVCLGWLIFGVMVFLRNYLVFGSIFGSPRTTSDSTLWENLRLAVTTLLYCWFPNHIIPWEIQGSLLLCFFLILILIVVLKKQYGIIRNLLSNQITFHSLSFGLVYLTFIVLYSTFVEIDDIGPRLLFPTMLCFIFITSIVLGEIIPLPLWLMRVILTISILYFFGIQYPQRYDNFYTTNTFSRDNPRIQWICKETKPQDWIIGDSTFDISIACKGKRTICFIPSSRSDPPPNGEMLHKIIRKLSKRENIDVYIVIRKGVPYEESFKQEWIKHFGEAITDLVFYRHHQSLEAEMVHVDKRFIAIKLNKNVP